MAKTLDEIIRKEFFNRNRYRPRTWTDGFPYDSTWYEPELPRGRPYDGAIVKDGKLIIPSV